MKASDMQRAFKALDKKLTAPLTLVIGGGAALLLAHGVPLATQDIDGLPLDSPVSSAELDPLIKEVGKEIGISPHWYNDYFNAFTYTLPEDFRNRLQEVFKGGKLCVRALGKEDLLIMKCFAGREKDIGHARALVKRGANVDFVESHIHKLAQKKLATAEQALEFLANILDDREFLRNFQ